MTLKDALYELNFAEGEIYDQVFYDDKPYEFDEDGYKALDMAIEALKQNQWIPCSERLPKKDEEVLVYLFGDSPYIAWHDGVNWCTEDFTVDKDDEPIAWMPLPKAYERRTE